MNVPRLIFPPLATFCRAASAALSSAAALTNYVFCSSFGQASDGNDEFKELSRVAVNDSTNPVVPRSRATDSPLEWASQAKARRNSGCESAPEIERRAVRLTASRRRRGDTR